LRANGWPGHSRRYLRERITRLRRDRADVMALLLSRFLTLGLYLTHLRLFVGCQAWVREGCWQEIAREAFPRAKSLTVTNAAARSVAGGRAALRAPWVEQQHAEHGGREAEHASCSTRLHAGASFCRRKRGAA